jgi:hypothetical protein
MRYVKYLCNYHFVWIPKYRKDILVGEVAEYTKEVLKSIAEGLGCEVSYPRPEGGSFLPHHPTMPPHQPKGWEGRCWAELNRRHTRRVAPTLPFSKEPEKR